MVGLLNVAYKVTCVLPVLTMAACTACCEGGTIIRLSPLKCDLFRPCSIRCALRAEAMSVWKAYRATLQGYAYTNKAGMVLMVGRENTGS